MLAEFRLIPGLNNLFDKLIWRKYTASNHVVHGQNENCDCSPVSITTLNTIQCDTNTKPGGHLLRHIVVVGGPVLIAGTYARYQVKMVNMRLSS